MKTGTCSICSRTDVPVVRSLLVGHYRDDIPAHCRGSSSRPAEIRAKERTRRLRKKEAAVDAIRGDTSVVLDALLTGRDDLDAEFTLASYRLPASHKYKLITGKRLPTYGTYWAKSPGHHDLYCAICGYLVVQIRSGYWSQLTIEERAWLLERHTMICALQMLAGLRHPVMHGTTLREPNPDMLWVKAKTPVPPDREKVCPECEAPAGLPCVGTSKPNVKRGEEDGRLRLRKTVHDARRAVAASWTVESFDPSTLVGVVARESERFRFHSTSFSSDTSLRWPRVGETVEVVLTKTRDLLSVHGE